MTSLNPFEDNQKDDSFLDIKEENQTVKSQPEKNITIKVITNPKKASKKLTVVSNWSLPKDKLKVHKSNIQRSLGISGAIKNNQNNDGFELIFSGDNKGKIKEYIKSVSS
tara:strand:+ start:953 stop:1282 length:330 start_codon:yes stop_codon:yes gene_type:complete